MMQSNGTYRRVHNKLEPVSAQAALYEMAQLAVTGDKLPMAQRPSQYFAALTNMRSVGVMGDERTYDYAIALRAVTTTDFMTAEVTILPTETLTTAANRIVNEVKNINRVLFDYTTKPPATIEFE